MGKRSWCRGLELPDLFPVESAWSVRNGRDGEQWDQNGVILHKELTNCSLVSDVLKCINWVP